MILHIRHALSHGSLLHHVQLSQGVCSGYRRIVCSIRRCYAQGIQLIMGKAAGCVRNAWSRHDRSRCRCRRVRSQRIRNLTIRGRIRCSYLPLWGRSSGSLPLGLGFFFSGCFRCCCCCCCCCRKILRSFRLSFASI